MRFYWPIAGTLAFVGAFSLAADEGEETSIGAVLKLGGKVFRNEKAPGHPVYKVIFEKTRAKDAIRPLQALKQLKSLWLDDANLTDDDLKLIGTLKQLE